MAHELDFSLGRAAMFSVRETPWHREGVVLDNPPSVADALQLAGLDYQVLKVPTVRVLPDGRNLPNELAFSTIRNDTGAELGMVGRDYTPLQNRDAFRILEPLVGEGFAKLETAGALRGGADVWVLFRWDLSRFGPIVREVFTDEVQPYGLYRNNHNGRSNVVLMDTPIRVVCANTLGAALGGVDEQAEGRQGKAVTARHTLNVEAKVVEAAQQLWGAAIERYEIIAKQYRTLKGFYLDEAMFRELVQDVVAPDPRNAKTWNPEARMAAVVIERAEKKRDRLAELWTNGTGHQGDRSAWEAYNAVAEAMDHDAELWPTRTGVFRTQSLLDGSYGQTKRQVLAGLVGAANEASVS